MFKNSSEVTGLCRTCTLPIILNVFLITKAMALSCLFVVFIGKHFQNSFHRARSIDNQGFDTECLKKNARRYQEQTDTFQYALPLIQENYLKTCCCYVE